MILFLPLVRTSQLGFLTRMEPLHEAKHYGFPRRRGDLPHALRRLSAYERFRKMNFIDLATLSRNF